MRAPYHFFGSINPRVLAPAFVVLILCAFTNANAQLPMPGLGGGFEIDGNLFSNNPGGIIGLGNDWLDGPAGPGTGVLNADGTPKDPNATVHVLDGIEGNDADVFDGSNKVFHNPNTYKWKSGSAPQKDDIQNGLVHFSTDNVGNHWMRIAGDRKSINGSSYIDYEFLQATLTKNANGTFTSGGPHNGRTIGDILLTIHLTQGGSQAQFFAQRWQAVAGGYDYVSIPFPSGEAFVAANIDSIVSSTFNVFGAKTYSINQFGEAAVNLEALLPNFGTCFGIATVFVRTKSSTSNDAVLKDFIEPMQVNMCLDTTPPQLIAPPDVTLECDDSTLPGDIGLANATDDCETNVDISYEDTVIPGSCADNYVIQRVWTAVDGCGNTDQATQTITVVDNSAPVIISSPGPVTIQCIGDIPAANPNSVVANGECGQVTVSHVGDQSNGQTCPQVITRTYRVTDRCGNSKDVTQTITIDDTTAPNVGTLSPINLQCRDNVPAPNIAIVQASDNCGTPVVTHLSDVSNGQTCPEVITRTYRVTDACGNVTDRTQTITIDDDTVPTVGIIYPVTVECLASVPAPDISVVSASDNCSTPVVRHLSDVSNGQTCPQVITRTYRVTDVCGNVTDRTQTITIDDNTLPSFSNGPADITVSCSGGIPGPDTGLLSASDNCSTPVVSHVGDVSDGKSCPQVVSRTYRATDACGNTKDWVQKITVDDRTAPSVQPLSDVTVSCAAAVPVPNPGIVQGNDNCGQVFVSHLGDQPYGNGCGGKIMRTYRVVDQCGNATTVTQKIVINDQIAPIITEGPDPVTIECDGDIPPVDLGSISATDNCGTVDISWLADSQDGNTCPKVIRRKYIAKDLCGNQTMFVQVITVDDNTPPQLSNCPADRTMECGDFNFQPPTATDNCDASPEVKLVDSRTTYGPEGWTIRIRKTWKAFDECNNASQECSQLQTLHCESDHLSSLTQGAYGSHGGYWNGLTTLELVQSFLTTPMVVGKPGRSVTFRYEDADCVIQRLPGNTTPSTLPAGLGDKEFSSTTCQVPGAVPIPLNSGKFESVLLGQTITLKFNARLSLALPLFPLTHKFCTQGALAGKDGLMGTHDDKIDPNSPVKTFTIPNSVLTALNNLGLPPIVYGLIELCDRALAGQATGGASLSDINQAATAINEGFDGCRFIVPCDPTSVIAGDGTRTNEMAGMTFDRKPTRFEVNQNAPNPFNPATTIRFSVPQATAWTVSVYDVAGRLVKGFDGEAGGAQYIDVRWDGTDNHGAPVGSGVYFYRVRAGQWADVKKMVLLK